MSDNSTGWKCKQALSGRDEIGRGLAAFWSSIELRSGEIEGLGWSREKHLQATPERQLTAKGTGAFVSGNSGTSPFEKSRGPFTAPINGDQCGEKLCPSPVSEV